MNSRGIVALEAIVTRTPLVESVGKFVAFVDHAETGIQVDTGNPGSLAWRILNLHETPQLTNKLREQVYRKVNILFHWNAIISKSKI